MPWLGKHKCTQRWRTSSVGLSPHCPPDRSGPLLVRGCGCENCLRAADVEWPARGSAGETA
eukprot:3799626-Alexandrium_andersonii.AAC.1